MKKIRYTALILCMVVILAFTGAAFAYSASNISSMYAFSAGVVNAYARNHNTNCSQDFKEQWVAGESGWTQSPRTALSSIATRVPGSCYYLSTSAYKASNPSHVVYLRIRPTSGTITNINGYAFTSSSMSCPYGSHAK